MGRVRNAAALHKKIRESEVDVFPLSWEEIIILIEYKHLCDIGEEIDLRDARKSNG